MRVRFTQRYCAYYPGADPVLDDAEASRLIALGVCLPYDAPPAPEFTPATPQPAPPSLADDATEVDEPTDVEHEPAKEAVAEPVEPPKWKRRK